MNIKDTLSSIVGIFYLVLIVIGFFGAFIGAKLLYAWIAEQLGIPYVWVV